MNVRFTERELDIMQVLWKKGPCAVAQVLEEIEDDIAYNTVLTMLKVLEEKGHVSRSTEGKAHRYTAKVPREVAGDSALRRVTSRLFSGSPEALLLNLVKQPGITEDEVRRMRDLLNRQLGEGDDQ